MLQEYMVENETLRAENRDLQENRQQMARELKQVYKENEKLQLQIEQQRIFNHPSINWRQQQQYNPNMTPRQSISHQPWLNTLRANPAQLQPITISPDSSSRRIDGRPINIPPPKIPLSQRSLENPNKISSRLLHPSGTRNLRPGLRTTAPVKSTESVEMFNQRLREELAAIDGEIKSEEINQATSKFYKSNITP